MVVQQVVQKLLHNLVLRESSIIVISGIEILVRLNNRGEEILLSTPVYNGGNYIPNKVREAVANKKLIKSELMNIELITDEDKFEIILQYKDRADHLDLRKFKEDLEEFAWLAEEWRFRLDEEDHNDRLHVRV